MTEPTDRPEPGQWTPPPPPAPPRWEPPHPYQQPQPQRPQPQPPYQAPAPPYAAQHQQYSPDTSVFTPQPAPAAPKRRVPLIASLVAVVALAGGGAITYAALSDSSDNGGATPKAAVQKVVADMENSDLVGLLDDLAPGERDALATPVRDDFDKLKQLHVLSDSANPDKLTGVTFKASNLRYGDPITVNDHVQIVALTGGTIDLTGDTSKLPLSGQVRKVAPPNQVSTRHFDLAKTPVRVATEKVDGRWYPSLFYTAADAAAGHRVPSASDAIPDEGSSSPGDAVRDELTALLSGDYRTALAHLSPTELGAVHDYGGMLLNRMPSGRNSGVRIDSLDTTTTNLSGGGVHVGLKKIVLAKDGDTIGIAVDGECVTISAGGHLQQFCASDAARLFSGTLGRFGLSPGQSKALTDLLSGFTELGIATGSVDGKWYVEPVRSAVDVWGTLLGGLRDNDLLELSHLGH